MVPGRQERGGREAVAKICRDPLADQMVDDHASATEGYKEVHK